MKIGQGINALKGIGFGVQNQLLAAPGSLVPSLTQPPLGANPGAQANTVTQQAVQGVTQHQDALKILQAVEDLAKATDKVSRDAARQNLVAIGGMQANVVQQLQGLNQNLVHSPALQGAGLSSAKIQSAISNLQTRKIDQP